MTEKDKRIDIRVSEKEKATFKAKAKKSGKGLSEWAREALKRAK